MLFVKPPIIITFDCKQDASVLTQKYGVEIYSRNAQPARREEGEYIDVFNRRATQRAGMHRSPNVKEFLGHHTRRSFASRKA